MIQKLNSTSAFIVSSIAIATIIIIYIDDNDDTIRRILGRIRSKEASSIPKRKRSHDDVAGRFITLSYSREQSSPS